MADIIKLKRTNTSDNNEGNTPVELAYGEPLYNYADNTLTIGPKEGEDQKVHLTKITSASEGNIIKFSIGSDSNTFEHEIKIEDLGITADIDGVPFDGSADVQHVFESTFEDNTITVNANIGKELKDQTAFWIKLTEAATKGIESGNDVYICVGETKYLSTGWNITDDLNTYYMIVFNESEGKWYVTSGGGSATKLKNPVTIDGVPFDGSTGIKHVFTAYFVSRGEGEGTMLSFEEGTMPEENGSVVYCSITNTPQYVAGEPLYLNGSEIVDFVLLASDAIYQFVKWNGEWHQINKPQLVWETY